LASTGCVAAIRGGSPARGHPKEAALGEGRFAVKVAIVSGGSHGIGRAIAAGFAGEGGQVVIADLAPPDFFASDPQVAGITGDIAEPGFAERVLGTAISRFGKADILVNDAAAYPDGTLLDMPVAAWERVFAVNVVGPFLCAREAVRRMSTRHGGKGGGIVNVSSAASRLGSPGEYVDYAASKGAIDTFTIGLAKEVAEEGIRVNAVRPGVIYTGIHAAGGEPGRVDRVKGAVPMKRGGEAIEVARAILWLLSDESSYSTGTFIDVSGGR